MGSYFPYHKVSSYTKRILKMETNLERFVSCLCSLKQNEPHIYFAELEKKGIDELSAGLMQESQTLALING